MITNVAPATTAAARPAGRERTCEQCGATYRAPRATSRYCAERCKKRAQRQTPPTDPKALDLLRRWLIRRSYAGQITRVNAKDPRPAVYGLTVPRIHVLPEWNDWNPGASMTDAEFMAALTQLRIVGFDTEPRKHLH